MLPFNWYVAFGAGDVIVIVGDFLSTLLPLIGSAVVQPPTVLQIWRLLVAALAVSVSGSTLVVKLKLASAGFANPDSGSLAVHAMLTLLICQSPSDAPHETCGEVGSATLYVTLAEAGFPTLSVDVTVNVFGPVDDVLIGLPFATVP